MENPIRIALPGPPASQQHLGAESEKGKRKMENWSWLYTRTSEGYPILPPEIGQQPDERKALIRDFIKAAYGKLTPL